MTTLSPVTIDGVPLLPRSRPRQLTVLAVADEWFSAHGGISTFNRRLCAGLAAAGCKVYCLLPSMSVEEAEDASARGVGLLLWPPSPGRRLRLPPRLPGGGAPDIVIGHGRITGQLARFLADAAFPGSSRLHFLHVAPDELEWWRQGRSGDPGARAEERTRLELSLALGAARAVAVGPRLHSRFQRDLHGLAGAPPVLRLDPGFDIEGPAERLPAPGGPVQVLLPGRMEDLQIKGADLAAKILGRVLDLRGAGEPEIELLVRGAVPGECARLRERLCSWAGRPDLLITPRPYSADGGRLAEDMARAHLVLMPSRAEGFGLVGVEAVCAGVPVLLGAHSGAGMLLEEIVPRSQSAGTVLPMTFDEARDVALWAHHAAALLRDPAGAFRAAGELRLAAARRRTWAESAAGLVESLELRAVPAAG